MTRKSIRLLDPEAEAVIATLSRQTRERLNILRLRLLLAPDVKKYLGREPDPLSESEKEALAQFEEGLRRSAEKK